MLFFFIRVNYQFKIETLKDAFYIYVSIIQEKHVDMLTRIKT